MEHKNNRLRKLNVDYLKLQHQYLLGKNHYNALSKGDNCLILGGNLPFKNIIDFEVEVSRIEQLRCKIRENTNRLWAYILEDSSH